MTTSNFRILAFHETPLGPLCLRRRELLSAPGTVVTEVTLDHQLLMSSYNTVSERALASVALEMHEGSGLTVLVGGLGLGYTAHEALLSPRVARVEVAELLPQVVRWLEDDLIPLSGPLKADPRFRTVVGDIFARMAEAPQETFDLILIDVDHAPDDRLSPANTFFYSEEGLEGARQHLRPGGILGVWSSAESPPFARVLDSLFPEVRVQPVTFFNDLAGEETTDWLFFARAGER